LIYKISLRSLGITANDRKNHILSPDRIIKERRFGGDLTKKGGAAMASFDDLSEYEQFMLRPLLHDALGFMARGEPVRKTTATGAKLVAQKTAEGQVSWSVSQRGKATPHGRVELPELSGIWNPNTKTVKPSGLFMRGS
jgi:hypothetical protein